MKLAIATVFVLWVAATCALAQGGGPPTLPPNALALVAGDPVLPYPDDAFTCFYGTGQAELFLIVVGPWNDTLGQPITTIGGFECKVELPEVVMLGGAVLPPGAINFLSLPEFIVGCAIPVVNGQALLATLPIMIFPDPLDGEWPAMIAPVQPRFQSIEGFAAVADFDDEYSLSVAMAASEDYIEPVFWFFPGGESSGGGQAGACVVDRATTSWGGVKALYR